MQVIDLTREIIQEFEIIKIEDESIVKPDYAKLNLANIGATMLKLLGVEPELAKPLHELHPYKHHLNDVIRTRAPKYLFILVNSLSSTLLTNIVKKVSNSCEYILKGLVTSTFPSITPTALMTLYTGLSPLAHGVLGFELYLEKQNEIVIPFKLTKQVTTELLDDIFGTYKNLFTEALKGDILPTAIIPSNFSLNPATARMLNGAKIIEYSSLTNILSLKVSREKTHLLYLYFSKLDEVLHTEGKTTPKLYNVLEELASFIRFYLRRRYHIVLFSDHSHIDIHKIINIGSIHQFKVADNGGRVLSIHGSNKVDIVDTGSCTKISGEQLLKEKWFGKGTFSNRVGDTLFIAKDNNCITFENKTLNYQTSHGGWSTEEMIAPFALFIPLK